MCQDWHLRVEFFFSGGKTWTTFHHIHTRDHETYKGLPIHSQFFQGHLQQECSLKNSDIKYQMLSSRACASLPAWDEQSCQLALDNTISTWTLATNVRNIRLSRLWNFSRCTSCILKEMNCYCMANWGLKTWRMAMPSEASHPSEVSAGQAFLPWEPQMNLDIL